MPNTHSTLASLFGDIADAIRAKTGGSADIVADDFPTAIAAIPTGGGTSISGCVRLGSEWLHEVTYSGTTSVNTATFPKNPNAVNYLVVAEAMYIGSGNYNETSAGYAYVLMNASGTTLASSGRQDMVNSIIANIISNTVTTTVRLSKPSATITDISGLRLLITAYALT